MSMACHHCHISHSLLFSNRPHLVRFVYLIGDTRIWLGWFCLDVGATICLIFTIHHAIGGRYSRKWDSQVLVRLLSLLPLHGHQGQSLLLVPLPLFLIPYLEEWAKKKWQSQLPIQGKHIPLYLTQGANIGSPKEPGIMEMLERSMKGLKF